MEGHTHPATALVAALALVAISGASARALERTDRTIHAYAQTAGEGVDYGGTARFVDTQATTTHRHRTTTCHYTAEPYDWHDNGKSDLPPPPEPDAELYKLFCNGDFVRLYWRLTNGPDPAAVTDRVETLIDRLDVASTSIDIRPNHAGVVAIPAYYWVSGYDGGPITATDTIGGAAIVVTARLRNVEWDFGDGTPTRTSGLGQAWPERSDVNHQYRYPSPVDHPYAITATLWFEPTYTVAGVPGAALDPFPVQLTTDYEVREIQAVGRN